MTKKERYSRVLDWFAEAMPEPKTELHYDSPFHLLLAVILSAQCTDKRVNIITPPLFEAFPDAATLAASDEATVYEYIKSVSYPNNKTRSLLGAARRLVEAFGGEVPDNIDDLLTIPGVGRKTANVMLSVVWKRAAMAVDTHVFRVSERIGLTTGAKTPRQTEEELVKNIPQEQIPLAHHWLILHGRYVCKARRPDCPNCGIADWCRWYSKHS
ncbi:MAG: endonuclease III [Muribaculaceae bacterium]|nr:endonuclease III [Bacteroidales bacterium]MDY4811823.1 endonuclease III [Muribaculaceae bacterium]